MRVAIVHYWLLGMRGGEKVVEALCRLYPDADLFTLFYQPDKVSDLIRSRPVTTSFLNAGRRFYRSLLPLMPLALEHFDLRDYDLVVSSESGPAKGVLTRADTLHICYCHTPMRYLWDLYPEYLHDLVRSRWRRMMMAPVANYLRLWDYATAARVDDFVANGENTRKRIWKAYRREAHVIHPPVAVETFFHRPAEDYFLMVSELVPYKRLDYAVRFFARTGRRLKIAGDGPEFKRLRKIAGGAVEFCGRVSDTELRDLYARSRALVVPGEEDFGITMVEALASGKPVIALGRGGSVEIVPEGGGVLYEEAREEGLADAVARFEGLEADARALQTWAVRFSEARFAEEFRRFERGGSRESRVGSRPHGLLE
jgi:glycosyltransferase involved in cell wall biosynthesis